MGFLSDLFESDSESKSKTRNQPWEVAAPGLTSAAQLLNQWVGQPQQFFPGQTYAEMTPEEQQALNQLRVAAGAYPGMMQGWLGPAQQAYGQALGMPEQVMGMGLQDVAANPALAGVAERIQGDLNRNLQENIMPQLKLNEGIYGSQQVAQGIAARGTQEAYADALADLYGGAWGQGLSAETTRFGQGLQSQAGAMGRAPMLADMGARGLVAPADLYLQAGGISRTEEQRAIDEAMARHQFAQTEPYNRAAMATSALMGPAQAFGTRETEIQGSSTISPFQQIGGLAMGLGMLGGGLGGMGLSSGLGMNPYAGGYQVPMSPNTNRYMQGWYGY